jgi:hypothetical protein
MKRRSIGLFLSVAIAAAHLASGPARAEDAKSFKCDVRGGSFVLDDTDFQALAGVGITRENFASSAAKYRVSICDTRMVARLVKAGKADTCDFDQYQVVTKYFDKSELAAAVKAIETPHAGKCR